MPVSKRRTRRRWVTVGAVVGALALLGAACGDDDDSSSSDDTGEETADSAAFCDAGVTVDALFAEEEASPEAVQAGVDELTASAPDAIADDVQTFADAATADSDPFENPEFFSSYLAISNERIDACGYEAFDVTGVDYAYEGMPESISSGKVAFRFENATEAGEFHEGQLLRFNDDTTETLDELLALSEEEGLTKATPVGGMFAPPGETLTSFTELDPGRYAIVCFIPVGDSETPHFVEGMAAEFEVT